MAGKTIYSTLNYLLDVGEKDGKERGSCAGACRQFGKLLLRHGKRLFGPLAPEQQGVLEQLVDRSARASLEQLVERFAGASTWPALLEDVAAPGERPADPEYLVPYEFDPEPMPPSIDEYALMSMQSGEKIIMHVRFQRMYQENLGAILYRDSRRVQTERRCPVDTVVLLLWPGADGPGTTGEYAIPTGGVYRYHLTRLWEKDVDDMLSSPGTVAYAPLGKYPPEHLPEVIRKVDEVIESRNEEDRENLWVVVYASMGLRFPAEQVHEVLAHRLPYLFKLKACRGTMSGGYYAALSDAEADGALQAARCWVRTIGRQRLGEPAAAVAQGLESIRSLDRLEQLAARVLKGASWQEVLAAN